MLMATVESAHKRLVTLKFFLALLCVGVVTVLMLSLNLHNVHLVYYAVKPVETIEWRRTLQEPPHKLQPALAANTSRPDGATHVRDNFLLRKIEVMQELEVRRQRVEQVCATSQHVGRMQRLFINAERRLAYCFVPKTGCTFWKRVFTFLSSNSKKVHKSLKTPVSSPFDIPRLDVHMYTRKSGVSWERAKNYTANFLRFMFARDPYTRLWSDYLDKFFLPDFWARFGTVILARRRPRPSAEELQCGIGVTFQEFVQFALYFNEPHWMPVSSTCDPCKFHPHVIGKMDTYTRDARAILDQAGLGRILDGVDWSQHVKHEVETLIEYNFQKIHKKSPELGRKCITDSELARRLWTVFQYNGYISEDLPFAPDTPYYRSDIVSQVLEAIDVSARNGTARLKQQKARLMEDAFKQLPKDLLKKIEERYSMDFQMFGYRPRVFS